MVAIAQRPVLVLNRNWEAIDMWPLRDAISKLINCYEDGTPKAEIIGAAPDFQLFTWDDWSKLKLADDEEVLRGCSAVFKIPQIIKVRYDKTPAHTSKFSRKQLYKRDKYTCMYCGRCPGLEELTMDHIIPKSQGGKTTWENCCLACVECNFKKANRTPEEAGMPFYKKNFVPKKPRFTLLKGDIRLDSWRNFISDAYWNVELE
jgi:hypothetical protein